MVVAHMLDGPIPTRLMFLHELTYLSRQWLSSEAAPLYSFWMASSEVDQKFLGHFAKTTSIENNYLSSFLFRVLGLSVILAEKLLSARKAKKLDPVRNPKDKHLIHHILWLAREGLVMVEQYVLPMVGNYVELKVLAYKLRASFYHIFVLFHNDPPVNNRINRTRSGSGGAYSLYPDPLTPRTRSTSSRDARSPQSQTRQRSPTISLGGAVGGTGGIPINLSTRTPPGLSLPHYAPSTAQDMGNGSATFLLPLKDYTPEATKAFISANTLAESLLPGSHPIRLSVRVEYVAYLYDCLNERDQSRRMARLSIRQVYEAKEGMDDESFEDAAEMVGILGRMMRRGVSSAGTTKSQSQAAPVVSNTAQPASRQTQATATGKHQGSSSGSSSGRGRRRNGSTTSQTAAAATTTAPTTWV